MFLEDGGGFSLSCLVEFTLLLDGVVRRLILDEYDDQQPDSLTQEAIAFYNGSRFDQRCEIRIRSLWSTQVVREDNFLTMFSPTLRPHNSCVCSKELETGYVLFFDSHRSLRA